MTTKDDSFRSITGQLESAEPSASDSRVHMASPNRAGSTNKAQPSSSASENASTPQTKQQILSGSRSLTASGSPSTANSPMSSRDTSPARPQPRQQGTSGTIPKSGLRSRKSSTDVSPSRSSSLAGSSTTVPSAAAIQRALSSASAPQLPPISVQDPSRVPRPQKSASGTASGDSTPHWPISPRLKSPPPSSDSRARSRRDSLRNQAKKSESSQSTPSIYVQSSSPASTSRIPVKDEVANSDPEEPQPVSMKANSRGASGAAPKLETVQEASLPTTPGFDGSDNQSLSAFTDSGKTTDDERRDGTSSKVTEDLSGKGAKKTESGSDSGGTKQEDTRRPSQNRASSTQRPKGVPSKASFSSLTGAKTRTEAPSKNMTVETETVPSIPQPAISGNQERSASGRGDPSGSLRLKPSNETIRPKKERQKPKRKAPSVTGTGMSTRAHNSYHHLPSMRPDMRPRSSTATSVSGSSIQSAATIPSPSSESSEMAVRRSSSLRSPSLSYLYTSTNSTPRKASSKADVFEAKVASAVDEANSSDSDETFVYESNPPEAQPHRSRHHHSRTPSMTSIASLHDPRTVIRDSHKAAAKKSSMKFANNPYNNPNSDPDGNERGDGTIRGPSGRVSGGSSIHHHHIGRHGHGRGNTSHPSILDTERYDPNSYKNHVGSSRHSSQPNSPRFQQFRIGNGNGNGNGSSSKKNGEYSVYDIDAEGAADDERTPLIGSIRGQRSRPPRRPNSASIRQLEHQRRRNGGFCRRFAGFLVMSILLLVLIFSAVGLIFATTKPLYGVSVREIQNVIATQEEIMLDLVVEAVNPNVIGVTVADMDINIFAKSKHVGSDRWWREHSGHHTDYSPIHIKPDIQSKYAPITNGIDEGTDPIDEPEVGEPRTMLLGRIFHFDSPLTFDGSFIKRHSHYSLGELRLAKPGNKTEAGGVERWEEVLQYPFELIVRGVLKYQLPLSTRDHTVPITGSYYYDPDEEKKKIKAAAIDVHASYPFVEDTKSLNPWGRWDVRGRLLLFER